MYLSFTLTAPSPTKSLPCPAQALACGGAATSQHLPTDLHRQPGTNQEHGVAVIRHPIITMTSAIQVTIFKLLLIAINLPTQQPNGIYRPGGREGNAWFSGPNFISLFKAGSEPPRF